MWATKQCTHKKNTQKIQFPITHSSITQLCSCWITIITILLGVRTVPVSNLSRQPCMPHLSSLWAWLLSQDILADAGLLCNTTVMFRDHNKRNTSVSCLVFTAVQCHIVAISIKHHTNMSPHLNGVVSSCLCTCCDSRSDGLGVSCAPAVTICGGVQAQTSRPHVQCGMWATPSGRSCGCWMWRCIKMSEAAAQLHDNRNEYKLGIKSVWMWKCVTRLAVPAGSRDLRACKTSEPIDTISYPRKLESTV
jgi:hypothetical protein